MRYVMILAAVVMLGQAVPVTADPGGVNTLKVEWYTNYADPLRSYCVGDVRGVWCHVTQRWREWSFDKWQHWKELSQCPVTPPRCDAEFEPEVDRARAMLRAGGYVMQEPIGPPTKPKPLTGNQAPSRVTPQYVRNGEPSTRDALMHALEGRIPNNSQLRRITIIGDEKSRKAALAVVGKPAWAIVRAFAPDDWYVETNGFVANGSPTVYIQEPNGKVIHRQDDLTGLETAIERANPNYDPARDPDLRRPSQPSSPVLPVAVPDWLSEIDWRSFSIGAIAAGAMVALWSVYERLKGNQNVQTK